MPQKPRFIENLWKKDRRSHCPQSSVATFLASRASSSAGRFFFVLSSCSRRHSNAMSATCPCTCSTYTSLYSSVSVHVSIENTFQKGSTFLRGIYHLLGDTRDVRLGRVCQPSLFGIEAKQSDIFLGIVTLITIHGKEFMALGSEKK
ncbi:hypothetical protein TNCV_2010311 [Trichonephila clavipes]|nr:hypothetical protein TNCV_2010311 [Trichonephila clavipes]